MIIKPGQVVLIGNKLWGCCYDCRQFIRWDKPIIGSLHVCEPVKR